MENYNYIYKLFEMVEDTIGSDYLDFDKIENKLNKDRKLCGLLYLQSLLKDGISVDFDAVDKDTVLLNSFDQLKNRLTMENALYLARCIIWPYNDDDCFILSSL